MVTCIHLYLLLLLLLLVLVAHHPVVVLVEKLESAVDLLLEIRLHVSQSHHHDELVKRYPAALVQVNLYGFRCCVSINTNIDGSKHSPRASVG